MAVRPAAPTAAPSLLVPQITDSSGLRGVLYRLAWTRYRFPPGGFDAAAMARPPRQPPTTTDRAAVLCAAALIPLAQTALFAFWPLPPVESRPSLAEVLQYGVPLMAFLNLLSAWPLFAFDAVMGGVHPSLRRGGDPALLVVLPLIVASCCVMLTLRGFFPLQMLVTAALFNVLNNLGAALVAPRFSLRKFALCANHITEMSSAPMACTIGFVLAFSHVSADGPRLAMAVGYTGLVGLLKARARETNEVFAADVGLIASEFWMEGLSFSLFALLVLPAFRAPAVALLAALQTAGVLLPLLLNSRRLQPQYRRLLAWLRISRSGGTATAPAAEEQRRMAAAHFAMACAQHVVTSLFVAVFAVAVRAGPNARFFVPGHWSAAHVSAALTCWLAWGAWFLVVLVAARARVRRRWGVDPVDEAFAMCAEFTAVLAGMVASTASVTGFVLLEHGQVLWWVYPEDGYSS